MPLSDAGCGQPAGVVVAELGQDGPLGRGSRRSCRLPVPIEPREIVYDGIAYAVRAGGDGLGPCVLPVHLGEHLPSPSLRLRVRKHP